MTPHICSYCHLPTCHGHAWHRHCWLTVKRRDPEQIQLGRFIAEFVWDSICALSRRNRA
jgi:hypothetical protein